MGIFTDDCLLQAEEIYRLWSYSQHSYNYYQKKRHTNANSNTGSKPKLGTQL